MRTNKIDDWNWVDAIQMAMPVFAQLGVIHNDQSYWERMYEMYMFTRNNHGDNGLFNPADNLWWRDKDFDPPYREPNGEDCYWSRGNGWVFAALVRVLDILSKDAPHRQQYEQDFIHMAEALVRVQRKDGFWNVSLHDPENFGGKETTGTSLFVYGMAWGINNGYLHRDKYSPVIAKAWDGVLKHAVNTDGFLGYVQGTGKEPKDSQPVTKSSVPNFEDFGLGCFLLAGSEVYKMSLPQGR
jgi:unsaturated rhamnogalacturonyl hydrolase